MEEVVFLFFSKRSNLAGLFGTHWCCSSALCPRSVGASCGIRWKVFLFFFRWSILLLVIETKENEEEIQINSSGCRCCAVVWFLVLVFFNAMISDRWGLNWIGEVTYAVVKTLLVDECAPIYLTFKLGCQPDLGLLQWHQYSALLSTTSNHFFDSNTFSIDRISIILWGFCSYLL